MAKVLAITGLTGKKSGSAFARIIREHYEELLKVYPAGIRAFVRGSTDSSELEELLPEIEVFRGSLDEPNDLDRCFSDVDTIFHISGITLSPKIVDCAVKNSVRRVILVHTTGIY
ncbi:MAG: hypothetical protein MJ061_02985, partial [Mailhella sp.]|nr:hypothetical protein [Mailhella sp.]